MYYCYGVLAAQRIAPCLIWIYIKKVTLAVKKLECKISWINDGKFKGLDGKIKYKGGMSIGYPKHSFSLELNHVEKLTQDLPPDDDWILNASYSDKTFMRHRMGYELYRMMDSANISPLSTYITLSVNGKHQGLYILTQEMNRSTLGIDKDDYDAMIFKNPPVFHEKRIIPQEKNNYYQQKYPKIKKVDKSEFLEAFRKLMFHADDKTFADEIGDWVDMDNIIDWYLLILFTYNGDGIMKNFYLYKKNNKIPMKIAIWDYDQSFGRDGDNELNLMERPLRIRRSILFRRLEDSPYLDFSKRVKSRYKEMRKKKIFSRMTIDSMILSNKKMIEDAVVKNSKLWPYDSKYYFDANDFDKEVAIIKKYVDMRLDTLDKMMGYTPKP